MPTAFENNYTSYTPDGEVWRSGRNPYEVIGMSSHIPGITYTKLEYFEVTNGDQPWTPSEELINHKQCTVYANLSKDDEDDSTE